MLNSLLESLNHKEHDISMDDILSVDPEETAIFERLLKENLEKIETGQPIDFELKFPRDTMDKEMYLEIIDKVLSDLRDAVKTGKHI
jgi:hypothetical protein